MDNRGGSEFGGGWMLDRAGLQTSPELTNTYVATGWLLIDALDREALYEYDDLGRLTKITLPDGTSEYTYTYDDA